MNNTAKKECINTPTIKWLLAFHNVEHRSDENQIGYPCSVHSYKSMVCIYVNWEFFFLSFISVSNIEISQPSYTAHIYNGKSCRQQSCAVHRSKSFFDVRSCSIISCCKLLLSACRSVCVCVRAHIAQP